MGPEDFKERLVELAACQKAIAAAQVGGAQRSGLEQLPLQVQLPPHAEAAPADRLFALGAPCAATPPSPRTLPLPTTTSITSNSPSPSSVLLQYAIQLYTSDMAYAEEGLAEHAKVGRGRGARASQGQRSSWPPVPLALPGAGRRAWPSDPPPLDFAVAGGPPARAAGAGQPRPCLSTPRILLSNYIY